MLGVILVVVALVLAVLDAFAYRRGPVNGRAHLGYLLPAAVILICIALLIGVDSLISVKG